MSNQRQRAQVWWPLGVLAFSDARHKAVSSAPLRVIPLLSGEAPGSSAPLPSHWKNFSLSKATLRLSI
jgi:hypothetical protein